MATSRRRNPSVGEHSTVRFRVHVLLALGILAFGSAVVLFFTVSLNHSFAFSESKQILLGCAFLGVGLACNIWGHSYGLSHLDNNNGSRFRLQSILLRLGAFIIVGLPCIGVGLVLFNPASEISAVMAVILTSIGLALGFIAEFVMRWLRAWQDRHAIPGR